MRLSEKPLALPDGRRGILVVARDITQSERAEMTKEVFLSLGAKLSSVRTPVEAARAVYAAADQLWKWDAATLQPLFPGVGSAWSPCCFATSWTGSGAKLTRASPAGARPDQNGAGLCGRRAELVLRQEGELQGPETH